MDSRIQKGTDCESETDSETLSSIFIQGSFAAGKPEQQPVWVVGKSIFACQDILVRLRLIGHLLRSAIPRRCRPVAGALAGPGPDHLVEEQPSS